MTQDTTKAVGYLFDVADARLSPRIVALLHGDEDAARIWIHRHRTGDFGLLSLSEDDVRCNEETLARGCGMVESAFPLPARWRGRVPAHDGSDEEIWVVSTLSVTGAQTRVMLRSEYDDLPWELTKKTS